jgi:microsomal dipeptidase-like Zn-dependent dipeptidase
VSKGNGKANGKKAPTDNGKSNGVELVKQEHGGALNTGGTPGNKGNPNSIGILPSAIREYCRGSFAQRVPILEAIADGEVMERILIDGADKEIEATRSAKVTDRIKAIETLAKYGGVDKIALTVDEQPEEEMTPERVAALFERLQRIKTVAQLEKMLTGMAAKQFGGA